jgi:hypothetical protein
VETRRPYQNSAITSVISVFYMTRNADIVEAHQGVFGTEDELPDAMIASAATVVSPMPYFLSIIHPPL